MKEAPDAKLDDQNRCPGGERDRGVGAREPLGDQPPPQGWRNQTSLVRREGPSDGSPETVTFPRRADRQGSPVAIRC